MVNGVHDSGTSGLRSGPGEGHCDVFLGEALYSHSAFSTGVYKWVPANLLLGVTLCHVCHAQHMLSYCTDMST